MGTEPTCSESLKNFQQNKIVLASATEIDDTLITRSLNFFVCNVTFTLFYDTLITCTWKFASAWSNITSHIFKSCPLSSVMGPLWLFTQHETEHKFSLLFYLGGLVVPLFNWLIRIVYDLTVACFSCLPSRSVKAPSGLTVFGTNRPILLPAAPAASSYSPSRRTDTPNAPSSSTWHQTRPLTLWWRGNMQSTQQHPKQQAKIRHHSNPLLHKISIDRTRVNVLSHGLSGPKIQKYFWRELLRDA